MQVGKAFSYPFQDKGRIIQTGLIGLIPIIGQLALMGYSVHIIREVAAGQDKQLPSWGDFGAHVMDGIVVSFCTFVYMLPVFLLYLLAGGIESAAFLIIVVILSFFSGFLAAVGLLRYAAEDKFSSYFAVTTNFKLLLTHWKALIGTYIVSFVIILGAYIFTFVLALGIVTICLAFFLVAYVIMVNGYLFGDLARRFVLLPDETIFPSFQKQPETTSFEASAEAPMPTSQVPAFLVQPTHQTAQASPPIQEETIIEPEPAPTTFVNTLENAMAYTIQVPKINKFEPERAESLIKHIQIQARGLIFAIVAEHNSISWQIWDIDGVYNPNVITQAIKSVYPEAHVQVTPLNYPEFTRPFYRDIVLYEQVGHFVAPIKYITELAKLDPLIQFVQGMSELEEGERITQLLYAPSMPEGNVYNAAYKEITRSGFRPSLDLSSGGAVFGSVIDTAFSAAFAGREAKYEPGHQKVYEDRLANHILINCYILTQFDLNSPERSARFLGTVASMLQFHGENVIAPLDDVPTEPPLIKDVTAHKNNSALGVIGSWRADKDQRYKKTKAVLSTYEIASLWHLPNASFTAPEIAWQDIALPSKELVANQEGVIIGDSTLFGTECPIRIHPDDRKTHMSVIGKTGTGKSTLFHNCIQQDILAGKGVGVLDPHGKLVRDILRMSIPDERIGDVVVLDIMNFDCPPPLNPLQAPSRDDNYAAGEVVSILETIEGELPPRVANSLSAAFVTIRKEQNPTVRDVIKLFRDPTYRYQFIKQVDDPITQDYWEDYEQLSPSRQEDLRQPIMHRMGRFYRNPVLYPILCHPHPVNFQDLIQEKRIVLMSLGISEDRVPSMERRLVGVTLLKQFQMAAMSTLEEREFFLYVDEVQDFITAPLDVILGQARKFGLRLNFANQYLGQLGQILPSLMGNIGASIVFQIGQDDARKLSSYFAPEFEKTDLENMNKFQAAVKTRYLGNTVPAFKVSTRSVPTDLFDFALESSEAQQREQMIRAQSQENYTPMSKQEVLDWLKERYPVRKFNNLNQNQGEDIDWRVTGDKE